MDRLDSFFFEGLELKNFTILDEKERVQILEMRNREDIRLWMTNPSIISIETHSSFIESLKTRDDALYFAVLLEDRIIGAVYLSEISKKCAYIGIYKESSCTLKGVAAKMVRSLIQIAFEKLGLERLSLEVKPDNKRAIALYQKCDFSTPKKRGDMLEMYLTNVTHK